MCVCRYNCICDVYKLVRACECLRQACEMYAFRKNDRVSLIVGADLTFTSPGLREKHRGVIVDYTQGMYDPSNEMYSVRFDGETEIRYILRSDMQRQQW